MINGYTLKKVDGKTHIVHERDLGESSTWVDHVINGVPLKETLEWGYGMKEIELGQREAEKNHQGGEIIVNERNVCEDVIMSETSVQHSEGKGEGKFFRKRKVRKINKNYETKPKEKEKDAKNVNKVTKLDEDNKWRESDGIYEGMYDDSITPQPFDVECTMDVAKAYKGPGKIVLCSGEHQFYPPLKWMYTEPDFINIWSEIDFIEQGWRRPYSMDGSTLCFYNVSDECTKLMSNL